MTTSVPAIAIYPGSFDPVTLGHEDVAWRTLRVAERLVIAVAHSATHAKQPLFTLDERVAILREVFAHEPRVECTSFDGLLVDFARAREARFIVRGLRAVSDFEYELQMAQMNQDLWPEAETLFLTPDVRYSFLSASLVREVAGLGGDVSRFVSPLVLERIRSKVQDG